MEFFFYIFFEREQWKIENKKYQPMSQKHQILHGSFRTRNLTPKKIAFLLWKLHTQNNNNNNNNNYNVENNLKNYNQAIRIHILLILNSFTNTTKFHNIFTTNSINPT